MQFLQELPCNETSTCFRHLGQKYRCLTMPDLIRIEVMDASSNPHVGHFFL